MPIDEGLSFTVTDGVLVASMDLTLDQRIIPAEEEDAELMEELNVNLRCIEMAVTLPKIEVTFKQLAASFVRRSERGIAVLILRDATEGSGESFFRFGDATQVPENEFTAANQQYIKDALSFGPLRVSVVKVGAEGTLAQALAILVQKEQNGWITVCDGTSSDWTDLVSWIKAREKEEKSWKAVCYDTTSPDCMHVVNFVNKTVLCGRPGSGGGRQNYTPAWRACWRPAMCCGGLPAMCAAT